MKKMSLKDLVGPVAEITSFAHGPSLLARIGAFGLALAMGANPAMAQAQLAHPIPPLSEAPPGQTVIQLSIVESIDRAIHEATAVLKARNAVDFSGEQLLQSYVQFLPNLQGVAGYNSIQGKTYLTTTVPTLVDGRSHGGQYQLATTLNIFNGFSDWANLKASLSRQSANQLSLLRAKQLIALDIAQSFLQVILDRDIVRIAEKNLASSKAREDQLTEQTRIGAKNMADLFRQQAQTSSDETYLSNSQDKQRTDEIFLLRKLRLDPSLAYDFVTPPGVREPGAPDTAVTKVAPGNPPATDPSTKLFDPETKLKTAHLDNEAEMVRIALDRRADFHAQDETSKAYRWDVTNARSSYFPKLDFGVAMAATGRDLDSQSVNGAPPVGGVALPSIGSQLSNDVNYTVGLTLTWNIFDRWVTETNVERAKVIAKNSELDVEDTRNQVIGEVRQAYGDYRSVLQQLESSRKGLIAAQKAFETVEGRYQVGSANFVDLTTAQAALVQADAARAQAQISYALQGRILETAMGTADVQ